MNQGVVDSTLSTLVLRAALGRFATGVTIVGCRAADGGLVRGVAAAARPGQHDAIAEGFGAEHVKRAAHFAE